MDLLIKKYHFARPTETNIIEFARLIFDLEAVLCFDLEDVVRDLPNPDAKKINREKVITTIQTLRNSFCNPQIGFRVNVLGSSDFFFDLEAINEIEGNINLECMFLPKINNEKDIQICNEILKKECNNISEIIPIIENKKSFANLRNIIEYSTRIINKVAFGHCDFNYDNCYFPFYHQDSEKYWEWINYLSSITDKYNMLFINSPFLRLNDDEKFKKMVIRLLKMTNGTCGQITLSIDQLKLCDENYLIPLISTDFYTEENVVLESLKDSARRIVKHYEDNFSGERSFSFDIIERIIISPQEYLAAKRYLLEM